MLEEIFKKTLLAKAICRGPNIFTYYDNFIERNLSYSQTLLFRNGYDTAISYLKYLNKLYDNQPYFQRSINQKISQLHPIPESKYYKVNYN